MTDKDSSAAGSKPMTPFVHDELVQQTRSTQKVWKIKEYLTAAEAQFIQIWKAPPSSVSARTIGSCKELQSNYDKGHSRVVALEAEVLEKQQMLAKSEHQSSLIKKQFPPTNNQHRSSSNSRTHAMVAERQNIVTETVREDSREWEGHVARQCKEPKRAKDSQYFKDKMLLMEAKEKGVTLDAEGLKHSPHQYVDEGPNAVAAFMANLSSTSATNSQVNKKKISALIDASFLIIVVPPSFEIALSEDLRSACDMEHTKVLEELEAEISTTETLIN
ncbi:hypothetical protein Tco_1369452 [Tanacetum coccineum]